MPYAARRQLFQPKAFRPGMLAAIARLASHRQVARGVAQGRVNMLQRAGPVVKRRAAIVAAGGFGEDGGDIGGFQFWAAVAPVGAIGTIAMPRHDIFTPVAAVRGAFSAQMLGEHSGYSTRTLPSKRFGSQHCSGRSKLVKAISRIKADFVMLLVQLMIEKTNTGSQVILRSA